jgi:tRNA G18 (ribose-2'-O)-methylase SpoU
MPGREIVRSRANPAFKRLLERKKKARGDGLLLLEGATLVEEALAAGLDVVLAAFSENAADRPLLGQLRRAGTQVRLFSDALLQSLSEVETSQGVIALAQPKLFDEATLFAGTPLLVACWSIQNPGNLGGLLRTAEAAGATGALLGDGCADPFGWKALRGSMGSAFRLPLLRKLDAAELSERLHAHGLRVLAGDAAGRRRYDEVDWRRPSALLLGSEGAGLPDELLNAAHERVAVPLASPVESLNVGVAAGVMLFEAARQRRADAA